MSKDYVHGVRMSGGGAGHVQEVFLGDWYVCGVSVGMYTHRSPDMGPGIPTPWVLTPSGGHHNTYSWQTGGTHPTGMLSCFERYFTEM